MITVVAKTTASSAKADRCTSGFRPAVYAVIPFVACLWASFAFGQANNSNTWQTPGNQTVGGWVQMCINTAGQAVPCTSGVGGSAGAPAGAVEVTSSNTGSTAAVTATLPGVAGKFTYICGFYATGNTTTTANVTAVTVAGTVSGSMVFNIAHPVSPALGTASPSNFSPCISSSAVNTAITVTSAADAAGVSISVAAWGYQL